MPIFRIRELHPHRFLTRRRHQTIYIHGLAIHGYRAGSIFVIPLQSPASGFALIGFRFKTNIRREIDRAISGVSNLSLQFRIKLIRQRHKEAGFWQAAVSAATGAGYCTGIALATGVNCNISRCNFDNLRILRTFLQEYDSISIRIAARQHQMAIAILVRLNRKELRLGALHRLTVCVGLDHYGKQLFRRSIIQIINCQRQAFFGRLVPQRTNNRS